MAARWGTHFGNDTSSQVKQLSARVRVVVRFSFKLLIQSRTPVSRRNSEKRLVRIRYDPKTLLPGDGTSTIGRSVSLIGQHGLRVWISTSVKC